MQARAKKSKHYSFLKDRRTHLEGFFHGMNGAWEEQAVTRQAFRPFAGWLIETDSIIFTSRKGINVSSHRSSC